MGRRDTSGVLGGTHLARVDLLAAEGVVVGTHVGGVGDDLWLVVVLVLAALSNLSALQRRVWERTHN